VSRSLAARNPKVLAGPSFLHRGQRKLAGMPCFRPKCVYLAAWARPVRTHNTLPRSSKSWSNLRRAVARQAQGQKMRCKAAHCSITSVKKTTVQVNSTLENQPARASNNALVQLHEGEGISARHLSKQSLIRDNSIAHPASEFGCPQQACTSACFGFTSRHRLKRRRFLTRRLQALRADSRSFRHRRTRQDGESGSDGTSSAVLGLVLQRSCSCRQAA